MSLEKYSLNMQTAQVATRSQVKELTELWEASQGGTDASNISTGSSTFAHRLEQMRRKSRDLILRPVVAVSPAALPGLQALEARFPEGHVLPVHKLLRRIKVCVLLSNLQTHAEALWVFEGLYAVAWKFVCCRG